MGTCGDWSYSVVGNLLHREVKQIHCVQLGLVSGVQGWLSSHFHIFASHWWPHPSPWSDIGKSTNMICFVNSAKEKNHDYLHTWRQQKLNISNKRGINAYALVWWECVPVPKVHVLETSSPGQQYCKKRELTRGDQVTVAQPSWMGWWCCLGSGGCKSKFSPRCFLALAPSRLSAFYLRMMLHKDSRGCGPFTLDFPPSRAVNEITLRY
jgi:hypothetical protein